MAPSNRTHGAGAPKGESRPTRLPSSFGGKAEPPPKFPKGQNEPPLLIATVRVRVHDHVWLAIFSKRHPYHLVEILSRSEVSQSVSVFDIWISGQPPGVWGKEIERFDDVVSVDCLAEVGQGTLYRVQMQNPPVIEVYRRLKLPLPLPLRIQAGIAFWELVAREREFHEVMKFGRDTGQEPRVLSIRGRPLQDHVPLLTKSQTALLTEAMAAGYFAVPRKISLTELARKLGRNKSTVSERIAMIEKKLLESALSPRELLPKGAMPGRQLKLAV